ncbi:uncharacterized protein FOMMEDRAFT_145241 [Fomitiporia mediterranea MF3/22]|uniref:uncharacterized protein n=1 Tax=Fomitiporia mediterranea (strain MF3/22) TaxID=694068 RepID=UPI0004407341|nr:uncharacterized protein FOMMEDRAFT_145241 [Fomitiporia mediterranea MF3/22]EJD05872.1 hypothetical protein FOMMEDRAFT_145241 [Fomitiporia mediterranea MF3/22]
MKTTSAILIALTWRILIAVSTRTFFQPDEFFQSLEVAHRAVFGYGHLTWEWTASPPIRSVFFPALYMPVYWLLKIIGPKIFQGALAAVTDISTRELARQMIGERYAGTAFTLSLTAFFHILALSRTLSNSVETSLTTAALCFWPWHSLYSRRQLQFAFALAAASCLVRPTSLIIWIFLFLELYRRTRWDKVFMRQLFALSLFTGLLATAFIVYIDSLYFGRWTFTPLNFVFTNLSSVSLFYGRAPWHYYLTQGFPILLNVCLPFVIHGSWTTERRGTKYQKTALSLIFWTTFVYSLMGHKEWRFLHPLLPLMLVFSAKSLGGDMDKEMRKHSRRPTSKRVPFSVKTTIICALGIIPGLYVMRLHGSAQITVMSYLRSLDPAILRSVGFLMPCHSTPWQSYLHRPELSDGYLWALSCEPPLKGLDIATYADQTDIFYASPIKYLKQNFPAAVDPAFPPSPSPSTKPGSQPPAFSRWDHRWPSHLVFFGALLEDIREGRKVERYLRELGYTEVWSTKNGFEEDWRRRGGVRVWQWQKAPT